MLAADRYADSEHLHARRHRGYSSEKASSSALAMISSSLILRALISSKWRSFISPDNSETTGVSSRNSS